MCSLDRHQVYLNIPVSLFTRLISLAQNYTLFSARPFLFVVSRFFYTIHGQTEDNFLPRLFCSWQIYGKIEKFYFCARCTRGRKQNWFVSTVFAQINRLIDYKINKKKFSFILSAFRIFINKKIYIVKFNYNIFYYIN